MNNSETTTKEEKAKRINQIAQIVWKALTELFLIFHTKKEETKENEDTKDEEKQQ